MKISYLSLFFILISSCKRGQDPGACVKSFVDARKISTYGLESVTGANGIISSSFVAGGFFTSTEKGKIKNCAATMVFSSESGVSNIEVLTARHCASLYTKGPYKLSISGEDGYRELEVETVDLDTGNKILDGFSQSRLLGRKEATGMTYRPFESSKFREKIGSRELSRSIEQELSSYVGKLCGSGTSSPTSLSAQVGCFMFGDLVSFNVTPKAGSENVLVSIKKSGNIASNFISSSDSNWMNDIRQKYFVSRDYEIGSYLSTVYDCANTSDMKFSTPEELCNAQTIASAKSFLSAAQSQSLFAKSTFNGFLLKSEPEKLALIQKSIDDYAASYRRQVAFWQSQRQKLQNGQLSLGANYIGPKGPKYKLANLKDFQGSIPFIWRPYGILGYIDNSMANLDKGVSGSMLFLDGTPVAVISRVDGQNTSSGSATPSTGESKSSELNLPKGDILTQAEWSARDTSSTASNTSPVNTPSSTTTNSGVAIPNAPPSSPSVGPSNNSTRRSSGDASQSLDYGGNTSGSGC
ncbi:MAG: hypothetical protein WCI18_10710 [Pseudomonadota bacterium]